MNEYLFLMLREFQRPIFSHLFDESPVSWEAGDRADVEFSGVRVESSESEGDALGCTESSTGEHI